MLLDEVAVGADSILEEAEGQAHHPVSSPILLMRCQRRSRLGIDDVDYLVGWLLAMGLTTNPTHPDMTLGEWDQRDPEEFEPCPTSCRHYRGFLISFAFWFLLLE